MVSLRKVIAPLHKTNLQRLVAALDLKSAAAAGYHQLPYWLSRYSPSPPYLTFDIRKRFMTTHSSPATANKMHPEEAELKKKRIADSIDSTETESGTSSLPAAAPIKFGPVIFRYNKEGQDRFQLTMTVNSRKFNFDRSVTEATSAFLERMKANISKKVKNFDTEKMTISFLVGEDVYSVSTAEPFPAAAILNAGTAEASSVKVRFGDEEVPVVVNPPEVTLIKFYKQCLVGFPIFPHKIEGSPCFVLESSEFLWESRPGDENFPGIKARNRPRKPSKEVWTARKGSYVFTPTESDVNSYLRFTCTPSDGTRFGEPLTVEILEPIALPPVQHFFYTERLMRMSPLPQDSPNSFRVVSYNALGEMLTTPEWFTQSPKDSLVSDYRLPLSTAELRAYQGDILCLQEMEQKHFERYYSPFLSAECGLRGLLAMKIAHKSGEDSYEGVATFYNPSKFRLHASKTIHVRDEMKTLPFYSLLNDVPGLIERLEERNTVLQVTALDHIASGQRLYVGNTHLYFKPGADHIRLLQMITCLKCLQDELQNVKEVNPDQKATVLFCGDFNCTPPYASYRLATSGKISEDDYDWTSHETEKVTGISFSHNLDLVTAFPAEELTTVVGDFEGCIDYIFYQPSRLRLLQRYPPPSKSGMAAVCNLPEDTVSLPNFQAPSDHLPIISDFCLLS